MNDKQKQTPRVPTLRPHPDDGSIVVAVRMTVDLHRESRALAKADGRTLAGYIRNLMATAVVARTIVAGEDARVPDRKRKAARRG